MKKILLTLMTAIMLTMASLCSAADGSFIGAEQKSAEVFANGLLRLNDVDLRYNFVARNFSEPFKSKFQEKEFDEMRDFLRNQCGKMSDLKFLALRRTDEGDILYYRASSTRRAGVLLNVYFDKNKEITQFEIGPDDDQQQTQK